MGEVQRNQPGCGQIAEYREGHLPPRDAWRVDPVKLRRFFAPTDDRGFVLPDATIEVVRDLIEEDYEWPIDSRVQQLRPDVHHFHWMARQYDPRFFQGRTVPIRFRESPNLKGVLPRQFHNLVHFATLPPLMPRYRDMEQHLDALYLARRLFDSAEKAVWAQSLFAMRGVQEDDEIARQIMTSAFDRQFRGYRAHIEQMLGSSSLKLLGVEDEKFHKRKPHEVKKVLRTVIGQRAVNYVTNFA